MAVAYLLLTVAVALGAVLIVTVAVVLLLKLLGSGKRRDGSPHSFTGCPLMTAAESRFLRVLSMAAPNELVFPQVAMTALVRPDCARADQRYLPAFGVIARKRIDFVVCDRESLAVRCLVELDDASHDPARDAARDAITAQAGYRTIRVLAARRYDIDALRRRVLDLPAALGRRTG